MLKLASKFFYIVSRPGSFYSALTFLCFSTLCSAQRDAHWVLGFYAAGQPDSMVDIDFRSQLPVITSFKPGGSNTPIIETAFATSAISAENGDLLFYSDGKVIMNSKHQVVEKGADMFNFDYNLIWGGSMFLPYPGHPDSSMFFTNKWKLVYDSLLGNFYSDCYDNHYSIIDHKANNGLGKVVDLKHVYHADKLQCGSINAVRHANGRDWWFVNSEEHSNRWHKYLLSPSGFEAESVQDLGIDSLTSESNQTCFTPDGSRFARFSAMGWASYIDTYHFDRCTGQFSDFKRTQVDFDCLGIGGVSFSPNSRYMYVSVFDTLFQFDMASPDYESTKTVVGVCDTVTVDVIQGPGVLYQRRFFYLPYLAVDGKIYITSYGQYSNYIHVINAPNEQGLACDFVQRGFVTPHEVQHAMPKMPHYSLGKWPGSPCDTLTTSAETEPPLSSFTLRPNPADGYFKLEFPLISTISEPDFLLTVSDITGKTIIERRLTPSDSSMTIETANLPEGVYMVSLRDGNHHHVLKTEKLVILRE